MKKNITLLIILASAALGAIGQRPVMELTFTAVNNVTHVQLDSIKIMNRTQGCDTVLYWPDTVLSFNYVGISEVSNDDKSLRVFQNYPNPVTDHTTISMYVPQKDNVSILITDNLGRIILTSEKVLDQGTHSFRFTPGGGSLYFFTARWRGNCSSIKVLQAGSSKGERTAIEYAGCESFLPQLKALQITQDFFFSPDDELLYIGYADTLQSGILDYPEESTTYTFQFATNIPCPGMPKVNYEGQVYNTIQIFSQCWLKENLNVGTMVSGYGNMTDNGIIEKYCLNEEPDSCTKYGGLYQWDEMMQYGSQPGTQGICPWGWHLPTDEEWKVLEGAVDSQYKIGDPVWDIPDWRGYDAGTNLRTTSGWVRWVENGNGTDLFGFSGLPGSCRDCGGGFGLAGLNGFWWTSAEYSYYYGAWGRILCHDCLEIGRYDNLSKYYGFSVRCLRGQVDIPVPTIEFTFTAVNNASYIKLDTIKVINRTRNVETLLYWPDTILVASVDLEFILGDELLYIGYADTLQSGILDSPQDSHTYTFQFASNIPCPGTPTVEYEGQVYNTIQIFSQCWLKENLNVGAMVQNSELMSDNGIVEKYCYCNEQDSCIKYGGLYQWFEMMQYNSLQGAQGICPPGWHVPTDEEWKMLEGAADSHFGIGSNTWEGWGYRGYDVGTNLKTTSGWYANGNGTDLFGFSSLPGGYRFSSGNMDGIGVDGFWWTSTYSYYYSCAWYRQFYYDSPEVNRDDSHFGYDVNSGFSVRCLRDD